MLSNRYVIQAWFVLLSYVLWLGAFPVKGDNIPDNFLRNGDFENGPADWVWQDGGGR